MAYELTYIIRPDMDADAKKALVERFDKILADNGATVAESKDWSSRRLHTKLQVTVRVLTTSLTLLQKMTQPSTNLIVWQRSHKISCVTWL